MQVFLLSLRRVCVCVCVNNRGGAEVDILPLLGCPYAGDMLHNFKQGDGAITEQASAPFPSFPCIPALLSAPTPTSLPLPSQGLRAVCNPSHQWTQRDSFLKCHICLGRKPPNTYHRKQGGEALQTEFMALGLHFLTFPYGI